MSTDADQKSAFLAAIEADPYDTATRLKFSDWLEQQGYDDEAVEQRRCASPEWVEASRKLRAFAASCGSTSPNRTLVWQDYFRKTRHMKWDDPERDRLAEEAEAQEQWEEITYERVIAEMGKYVDSDGYDIFTQQGSEAARDNFGEQCQELWEAWQVVTGRRVKEEMTRDVPFSCSC